MLRLPAVLPVVKQWVRAGSGNRTRMACLEGRNFTIKLYPRKKRVFLAPTLWLSQPQRAVTNLREECTRDAFIGGERAAAGEKEGDPGCQNDKRKLHIAEG